MFAAVFALIIPASFYVGLRGWQWLRPLVWARYAGPIYWLLYSLLALAFPLSRSDAAWLPRSAALSLGVVGAYWLAVFQYALMLVVLLDLCRLLNRWRDFIPAPVYPGFRKRVGAAVLLLLAGTFCYGIWRARTPVVTPYEVTIPKAAGPYRELNVVMASDTHLGTMNGGDRARRLVEMINDLQPDLVLLVGDIMDDNLDLFIERQLAAEFSKLQPRLGTYAVLGNHDARGAKVPAYRQELERAGVKLLEDAWVKVGDSFYVVGRKDAGWSRSGTGKPLAEIMQGVDPALPILLMDHQPNRLGDAQAARVDLQVSGHTHRGQMFPYNFITDRMYEVDWGYLRKGDTHVVVSNGFGTWGPPIRIGNKPEVVSIRVRFAP
ncbi:MAG TPA: metallophosphoesterase [Symbiobacteriaceae bacterium]|nr:metallophosphoesterase [Symbiobacteriaceae bacterium]